MPENETDLRQEYQGLKKKIRYHRYRYYVLDAPVVSDYEFDQKISD